MQLQLPKWLCQELMKDTDRSVQSFIKTVLTEYVNNEEWREGIKIVESGKEKGRNREG